jgi:hypothetical protein
LSLAICHFTIYLHSYCLWSVQSVGCSIKWFGFITIWNLKEITGFIFMMLIIHRSTFNISWWLYCTIHGTHISLLCSVLLSLKSCFVIQLAIRGLKQLVRNRFGTHVYSVTANDLSSFRNLYYENLMKIKNRHAALWGELPDVICYAIGFLRVLCLWLCSRESDYFVSSQRFSDISQ